MFNKRIKNNDSINRVWVGQLLTPGQYYLIQAFEDVRYSNDAQLLIDIALGKALVNDGINDIIDVNDAINYLKGTPSTSIEKSEIFTTAATGSTVQVSGSASMKYFSLSVRSTGVVLAWSIILEGSLDGVNFSAVAKHTNLLGSGATIFPGVNVTNCTYFRMRCESIVLGLGTNVIATVIGSE